MVVRAGHAATPHLSLERASSTGIFEHLRLPRAARNGLVVNARVHRGSAAGKRRTSSLLFGSSRGRKRGARRSPEEAGDGAEGLGEMSVSRARFCLVVVSTVFSPPFRLPLQWYRRLFTRSLFDTSAGVPTVLKGGREIFSFRGLFFEYGALGASTVAILIRRRAAACQRLEGDRLVILPFPPPGIGDVQSAPSFSGHPLPNRNPLASIAFHASIAVRSACVSTVESARRSLRALSSPETFGWVIDERHVTLCTRHHG